MKDSLYMFCLKEFYQEINNKMKETRIGVKTNTGFKRSEANGTY